MEGGLGEGVGVGWSRTDNRAFPGTGFLTPSSPSTPVDTREGVILQYIV